jgi:Ca2+-binding EF-hand superfamily protein
MPKAVWLTDVCHSPEKTRQPLSQIIQDRYSFNDLTAAQAFEESIHMIKFLMGAAALALVAPAVAQIAPAAPQRPLPAQRIHTRAEVQATTAQMFARFDTNRDGFVTKVEADAAREQFRAQFAARAGEKRGAAFDRIDANRDGSVSRQEWDARTAKRQPRGAQGAKAPRAGMRGMHGFGGRMFEMADANRDGRVSLQEAQTAALQHFDMMDANRDGQVTPQERGQMRQQMRGHRG